MDKVCTFCNAKKWAGEQPGLCCSGGKIKLPSLDELPLLLRDLLLGTTSESMHFLEAIRKYNCCFQMMSFGAKAISEWGWMPTFKVQGQVYHLMGSLRTDSYIHLCDGLRSDGDPRNLSKPCILPSSYTGGPRYMHERTQDAMTYVRHYGRPDLFIMFTCNPKWVEITCELFPSQQYSHCPDLIAHIFRLQLCKLMDLILKRQIFGRVSYVYSGMAETRLASCPHSAVAQR
ncbi:unnamed protein product [Acanthosepion pharaonis]|uniref:Helitron helicase-like domain-containing protein n=1 Tax=Acanthosepion pharaonis TaxID=158019 RepID=A0A812AQN9_ACAPH|nr:unnamed protein product [Sepia pharaonis]